MAIIGMTFIGLFAPSVQNAVAHDEPIEKQIQFSCPIADVSGTLTLPHAHDEKSSPKKSPPCVVIVGGTMSHTRDGAMNRPGVPKRDALARLAAALADKGYASLRYDKVGHGGSKPKVNWSGTYTDEAAVAAAAIRHVRGLKTFSSVVVAGESAGGYLACLAAKDGTAADAYIFLGAHCGPGEAIYEYNFGSLVKYAESSPERRAWAEKDLRFELALGRQHKTMFAAAARGDKEFEIVDGDYRKTIDVRRRQDELKLPPDEMFKHIQAPTLALSGGRDLNVPPDHAAKIVSTLRRAGNHSCTCMTIPDADHSFQTTSDDADTRLRERYTFASFKRSYDPRLYREIIDWLDKTVAKPGSSPPALSRSIPEPFSKRGVKSVERQSKTENTPARTYLAPGVQIVEDITDKSKTTGVETLEGRIGPLILAESGQAHFIDMPGGIYCEEHPHSTESIIYTVRGKWVLCSGGRRQLMKPGTLFHFAVNTPTGYEVPFPEDAYILIFKTKRTTRKEEEFVTYLKGLADRLNKEHQAGVPYLMKDLPADHPAIGFAKEVNPAFDPKKGK
jgi:pimeloyl-ACP methyl ester carboxylesterase/quercetin dioxygenase-like cupin family protein